MECQRCAERGREILALQAKLKRLKEFTMVVVNRSIEKEQEMVDVIKAHGINPINTYSMAGG